VYVAGGEWGRCPANAKKMRRSIEPGVLGNGQDLEWLCALSLRNSNFLGLGGRSFELELM
jgi:hypothetical protein